LKTIVVVVFLAVLALSAPAYCSDFDFGSTARAAGLGGAGLALGDDSGTTAVMNPASPAVTGAKFKFLVPGFDFHVRGTTVGKLIDVATTVNSLDSSGAIDLVNDFAKRPTSVTLSSMVGFAGQFGITIEGEASATITPSLAAQEWANIGQGFRTGIMNLSAAYPSAANTNLRSTVTLAKAGDLAGANAAFAAYTGDLSQNFVSGNIVAALPAIQLSAPLQNEAGKWYVGTNIKMLRIESRGWQIVAAGAGGSPVAVDSVGNVLAATTFTAVPQPTQKRTSLKVDVGAIYAPNDSMFQYGIVVNNLVRPREVGLGLNQADTMVSVGVGAHPDAGMTVAADLINLTKANNAPRDLRMGAEWRLGRAFAIRAGYTGQGIAWGAELFGLDLAFAPKMPRLLSQIIRF
jgi:hypothetical protein